MGVGVHDCSSNAGSWFVILCYLRCDLWQGSGSGCISLYRVKFVQSAQSYLPVPLAPSFGPLRDALAMQVSLFVVIEITHPRQWLVQWAVPAEQACCSRVGLPQLLFH